MPFDSDSASRLDIHRYFSKFIVTTVLNVRRFVASRPNGLRYPLVGGTRQRYFDGINFKPRKLLENAQTPTSRVHAVLGGV